MEHKQKSYVSEDMFYEMMKNIIYIKYYDGHIDYCNYVKELTEYKSKISARLNDMYNYIIYSNNDMSEIYNLNKEVDERFLKYVQHLYTKLHYISEIKFCPSSSTRDTHTLSLKNGYLHNLSGPAQSIGSNLNFYYIDGESYDYEDWKSHPHIRYYKLGKLIRNIKS